MTRYAITIQHTGAVGVLLCDDNGTMELEELQRLVGGYIQTVPTWFKADWTGEEDVEPILVVNEEGKLAGLKVNRLATAMSKLYPLDTLVGDVVLMGAKGEEIVGFEREAAMQICERLLGFEWTKEEIDACTKGS